MFSFIYVAKKIEEGDGSKQKILCIQYSFTKRERQDQAQKKDPEKHNWDRWMQRQKEEECLSPCEAKVYAMGEGISASE